MNIRERLDSLSRGELAGLVVVIVLLLAAVGVWYTRSLPRPIDIATNAAPMGVASSVPSASVAVAPSASTSASPSTTLIVDVSGWVRKPGVFEFEPGDRVIDAVERAGGARDNADLTLLNLAAPLVDGQQILVPKEGAQVPGTVPGTTPGTTGVPGATGALVNINTADEATLETLNGVGPVLAASIIAYRTEHGPFTSIDQLDEVSGIGPATMEDLRSQVTV
ncbi:MAG: helix-hairpin-helix domain-containing protein [Actinomycetota bacterium]